MSLHRVPSYTFHRPTSQARVRINGRDYYLGPYGSKASRAAYAKVVAEQFRPGAGESLPTTNGFPDISINELLVRYLGHAEAYYVRDGVPTGETEDMKNSMGVLRGLYGLSRAREFGPLALKAVRQHMITVEKLSRNGINARINRIRRIFKWAVSEELIPPATFEGLRTIDGLRRGRCGARETVLTLMLADACPYTIASQSGLEPETIVVYSQIFGDIDAVRLWSGIMWGRCSGHRVPSNQTHR